MVEETLNKSARRQQRDTRAFTWLHLERRLSSPEIARLSSGLNTEVSTHPRYPRDVIFLGSFTEAQVSEFFNEVDFELHVVQGAQNPKLPFVA